jgi:hypothetical protein
MSIEDVDCYKRPGEDWHRRTTHCWRLMETEPTGLEEFEGLTPLMSWPLLLGGVEVGVVKGVCWS